MKKLPVVLFIIGLGLAVRARPVVVRADLDGPVDVIHAEYLVRAMEVANQEKADAFLLVIDTPGGLGSSMQKIIKRMLTSDVPVIAYVYPPGSRAASAGFFILISADIAAMAPGTRTGAAHPILEFGGMPVGGGEKKKGDKEKKEEGDSSSILMHKVTEDVLAYIRSITTLRGRNGKLAVAAVKDSKSYSDEEALKGNIIDLRAPSIDDLLNRVDGRQIKMVSGRQITLHTKGAIIKDVPMTFRERFLSLITNPNLAFLLGIAGLVLIYVEITHTGLILPGVLGAISLLLAVMGFSYLPINVTGVIFIILAFGLFIVELKMPGFGIFGTLGIVSLAFGAIMLVKKTEIGVSIDTSVAIAGAVAFGVVFLFLSYLVLKAMKRPKLAGTQELVGMVGEALTDINPKGKVLVQGTYWNAVSDTPISKGQEIIVEGVEGLKLKVKPK